MATYTYVPRELPVLDEPVVSGTAPAYREIIVDPNGVIGGYPTIQAAIDYALPLSSSTTPWTIRLLPGIYEQTAVLDASGAQYLSIVGAGAASTIINRATALSDSDTTYSLNSRDPVLKFSSSVGCSIRDLTIRHQGTPVNPGKTPTALTINDAVGFRASRCLILSTFTGVAAQSNTYDTTATEAEENIFDSCNIAVVTNSTRTDSDTIWVLNQNFTLNNCVTSMESDLAGPDTHRFDGGRMKVIGGTHTHMATGGNPGSATSYGNTVNITPFDDAAQVVNYYASGARFLNDLTAQTVNGAGAISGVITIWTSSSNDADWDVSLDGCLLHYATGTVTSARIIAGVYVASPSTNGTLGTTRLTGCEIRDLAGSGGTNRKDIVVQGDTSGGNKICKAVYVNGGRVTSMGFRAVFGSPPITGDYGKTEQTINRMTSTATFATAATVAVTLPIAFPVFGANNITDYHVNIEQPNGTEVYWVTGKTSTGFTLNSSNAASTATVRYTVTR